MGTVYRRGRRIWLKFRDADGAWKYRASGLRVRRREGGQRTPGEGRDADQNGAAGWAFAAGAPVTVAAFVRDWLTERSTMLARPAIEQGYFDNYILGAIGKLPVADVKHAPHSRLRPSTPQRGQAGAPGRFTTSTAACTCCSGTRCFTSSPRPPRACSRPGSLARRRTRIPNGGRGPSSPETNWSRSSPPTSSPVTGRCSTPLADWPDFGSARLRPSAGATTTRTQDRSGDWSSPTRTNARRRSRVAAAKCRSTPRSPPCWRPGSCRGCLRSLAATPCRTT